MDKLLQPSNKPFTEKTVARKSRRWWLWLGLVILAAVAGWWIWGQQKPAERGANIARTAPPTSVVAAPAEKGDIKVTLTALGTVTSLATVTIKSQISGQLVRIAFKEGDEVKKGDLLAEIDSRPYEAALANAQGQLARDQALLKGAQVDLARYQGLAAQNAVPHQTLDTQVALVAQYQGTVEADKAAVQSAAVNLQYCHIISPLDGRVGIRQVDQGNYVTPGDANGIVVITQLKPISVLFTVPEDELQAINARLQQGATLPVTAYDRTGVNKIDDGVLLTYDSQIDPTTGTIKLRAQFENKDEKLFPNQFVNVRLLVDEHKGATTIPTAGVQRGSPGTFVYLVNADNTVSVRKIKLGVIDGERAEVLSGLNVGDRIVVDGADKLREGAKVVLRAENPAAQPTAPPPRSNGKG
jgi:membrane fusion protein, multidrug efflux system